MNCVEIVTIAFKWICIYACGTFQELVLEAPLITYLMNMDLDRLPYVLASIVHAIHEQCF